LQLTSSIGCQFAVFRISLFYLDGRFGGEKAPIMAEAGGTGALEAIVKQSKD